MIIYTDPCSFLKGFVYSYPDGDPNGLTVEDTMKSLREKNIHLLFSRITEDTDIMIERFKACYDEEKYCLESRDLVPPEGTSSTSEVVTEQFGVIIGSMCSDVIVMNFL